MHSATFGRHSHQALELADTRTATVRFAGVPASHIHETPSVSVTVYNTIQYNTKFVKRHVAVASQALANRTVKKHRRRRTNVL